MSSLPVLKRYGKSDAKCWQFSPRSQQPSCVSKMPNMMPVVWSLAWLGFENRQTKIYIKSEEEIGLHLNSCLGRSSIANRRKIEIVPWLCRMEKVFVSFSSSSCSSSSSLVHCRITLMWANQQKAMVFTMATISYDMTRSFSLLFTKPRKYLQPSVHYYTNAP